LQEQQGQKGSDSELFKDSNQQNAATHRRDGDHARALSCLKMARQLGIWFYRTFDDRNFKSGPFQPPRLPADPTAELAAGLILAMLFAQSKSLP